ncbi:hypothetical protein FK85_00450 [Halorubrum saccharovorum]|uniref:Uncharacterized protein n=1 Tax=Halorubrum saccharovorum TaxID=2248 RepID=A0A081EVY1_9EURY|nr:hypothetical protein FK85_00450 [Halorubrum saccharovorum]
MISILSFSTKILSLNFLGSGFERARNDLIPMPSADSTKQFEVFVIEVGLNILNWVPISDELFVVLKRVVATSGEDHDSGHA